MAIYRTVNSDTWDDPWFGELHPDAKLLFLYMITNRRSTPCGVFEITPRAIAFETGLSEGRVGELLPTLMPKIVWWADIRTVWVRNFYKHQRANTNDKFAIGAAKSLHEFPPIVRETLCSAYPELSEAYNTLYSPTPIPPPSPPYRAPAIEGVGENKGERENKGEGEEGPPDPFPGQANMPPQFQADIALFEQLKQAATDLLDKKLPKAHVDKLQGWFTKYKRQLTAEIIAYGKEQTAGHTDGKSLDYFVEVMRRQIEEPNKGKPDKNGTGPLVDPSRTLMPQQGYSWDTFPDGSWKPMAIDPLTGKYPYGCKSLAEAMAMDETEAEKFTGRGVA